MRTSVQTPGVPAKPSQISALQAGVQKYLFSELVVNYRGHWKIEPTWGALRIMFQIARFKAHATFRH